MADQPVTELVVSIPTPPQAPRWDPPNLLLTLLAVTIALPPGVQSFPQPIPLKRAAQTSTLTWAQSPDVPTQTPPIRQYDWPNPRGKTAAFDLRNWTLQRFRGFVEPFPFHQTEFPNPLPWKPAPHIWTQSPAVPSAGNPPIRQRDWPNPRLKPIANDLKTWIQPRPSYYVEPPPVVGKDVTHQETLIFGRLPSPTFETPNLLVNTLAPPVVALPPRQTDWPLPVQRRLAISTVTDTIVLSIESLPEGQQYYPQPIPLKAKVQTSTLTWTQSPAVPAAGNPPIRQYDWPNPRGKTAPQISTLTWTQSSAVPAAGDPPIRQYDWPNPRLKASSLDLKTWTVQRFRGFTEPKPFTQTEWPNPPRWKPAPPIWTQSPAVAVNVPPLRQSDWPLPRIKASSIDLKTWTLQRFRGFVEPFPFHQTEWPNPLPWKPAPHIWTQNLLQNTLAPPTNPGHITGIITWNVPDVLLTWNVASTATTWNVADVLRTWGNN